MRLLGTYLWKEWRDHRAVLVGMVLAVPLLLAVMAFALPRTALDDSGLPPPFRGKREDFAALAALACFALFVVSLATDLVPGEARRGHRWFLERLPGGLGAAFRGKLVLFAVGGALFAAYGYAAGAVTCRLVAGEWPSVPSPGTATWVIAVAALWTFAVSCALPRGALSLPAVAALALLLALPAALLWMLYPSGYFFAWGRWESGALWTLGGVVAAWAGFRRHGFLRAGRACLAVGAVCAMPYWADAAHDAWNWRRHSVVVIEHVFLGEGGSYAFVNRERSAAGVDTSPLAPVIVDLRTGGTREVGSKTCRFGAWSSYVGPHRFVLCWNTVSHDPLAHYDTRTAEPVPPAEEERADVRRGWIWQFADGRRAWYRRGRLLVEGADGAVEERNTQGALSACGLGLEGWGPRGYYDFDRSRFYVINRLLPLRGARVWVRPGAWLTRGGPEGYRLFDPDTNAFAPAHGLAATDEIGAILDDGKVVACRRGEGPLLIAPETGAVERIRVPAGFESGVSWDFRRTPMRTPGGRRVLMLYRIDPRSSSSVFLRQDAGGFAATASVDDATLLGCPTEDHVIVHDGRAIYRLRFGSDDREELWHAR